MAAHKEASKAVGYQNIGGAVVFGWPIGPSAPVHVSCRGQVKWNNPDGGPEQSTVKADDVKKCPGSKGSNGNGGRLWERNVYTQVTRVAVQVHSAYPLGSAGGAARMCAAVFSGSSEPCLCQSESRFATDRRQVQGHCGLVLTVAPATLGRGWIGSHLDPLLELNP